MKNYDNEKIMGPEQKSGGFAYKILRVFTVVYPGEAITVLLLTFNAFLVLAAYYIIKPVREALILAGKGAEFKSYLSAVTVILLILVVKAFSNIASKFPRQKLISWVTIFFISNLGIFYLLSLLGIQLGTIGIIFFIWMGIFNVMVIAQFWAFANDIYTHEEGKRLFPLVAFGATFGAFAGAKATGWLIKPIGRYQLMLVAGGILIICILLTLIIHYREIRKINDNAVKISLEKESSEKVREKPLEKGGGFRLVFRKRYLLYIAIFVLLLNFINTNGEYILGEFITHTAKEAVETGTSGGLDEGDFIGKFYADFFSIVNLLAWFIQLIFVSRIFKWVGVRGALFFLPLIALGGYLFIAVGASLLIVKWAKILENGTDYSLMNTTRHALFLITLREEKYKAKAAIDTFFHRSGDVLSALLVFLGVTYLAFNIENFAMVNVVLVFIWIFLGILIFRTHKKLSAERTEYQTG